MIYILNSTIICYYLIINNAMSNINYSAILCLSDYFRHDTVYQNQGESMNSNINLISVILNNYNYSGYIGEAIASVLGQTYDNFELIIVDDGSTDDSKDVIEKFAAEDNRIKTCFKENGGQASAFNAGFDMAEGDVICFLDSDDYFAKEKLAEIHAKHTEGYTYIYTDHQGVDSDNKEIADPLKRYRYDGFNSFLVYYMSKYPGDVTSSLSMTRKLAEKIFPIKDINGWRIQADDCIVFQAGMMSRAYFLAKKLTYYRMHSSNGYFGRNLSSDYIYNLLIRRNALKKTALDKMDISGAFFDNTYNLAAEFKTHNKIDGELFKLYLKVLWIEMDTGLLNKVITTLKLYKIFANR